jgi:hypothetical protein
MFEFMAMGILRPLWIVEYGHKGMFPIKNGCNYPKR